MSDSHRATPTDRADPSNLGAARIVLLAALALLALYAIGASRAEPYEPSRPLGLTDSWRWRELEPLRAYKVLVGTESIDGTLFFATANEIVTYDGYACAAFPFPPQLAGAWPCQIYSSKNGSIYLVTRKGLALFKDGQWTGIRPHQADYLDPKALAAKSPFGIEVISLPDGLFQLRGNDLVKIPQIPEFIAELSFDRSNRLWLVQANSSNLVSYQFDQNGLKLPLERSQYAVGANPLLYPRLIASPASDKVWSVNWRQLSPAMEYSRVTDNWIPRDLSSLTGNNEHTAGFLPKPDELAIFTKSAILIQHNERWHTIQYPEFNVPSNQPFCIIRANGNIVIGGDSEKIYEVAYSETEYDSYLGLHFLCDDSAGRRWFISVDGAIIDHNPIDGAWTKHTGQVIDGPLNLFRSDDNLIWAAGAHEGAAAVSYFDGEKWIRDSHPQLGAQISYLSAKQLSDGRIIFGSGDDELDSLPGGLVVYNKEGPSYRYEYVAPPRAPRRAVGLAETNDGTLFAGGVGLSSLTTRLESQEIETSQFGEVRWIDDLATDSLGNLWVAIWGKGLFKYAGDRWENISAPAQIASSQVSNLLSDRLHPGTLWAATDRGISRFDGSTWHPLSMPKEFSFNREGGTLKQSADGSIWVNTATRNWYFRKADDFNITPQLRENFKTVGYKPDRDPPAARISTYQAESVSPAHILIAWKGVDKWSKTPADLLQYSFRLDDEPWSPFSSELSTVLLDVSAGDHAFQVRAMDLDGNIGAAAAEAAFKVLPPLWRRPWFVASATLTGILIAALIALLFKQRIRHILQMEEFKVQFFTNMSHELRTPLTAVIGPIESMLDKLPDDQNKKPLEIARRNAKKTLSLIDQILDYRNAEAGSIKIHLAHADIVETVRETVSLIKPLADERSQVLELRCQAERCDAFYDSEKIEHILNNLLSNAIKYTQDFGKISVTLNLAEFADTINAELVIEDNGCGIPEGKINRIFDIFYRADNASKAAVRGSGIGLAYTKKLVAELSGTTAVESPIITLDDHPQGTRFTVTLPLQKRLLGWSHPQAPAAHPEFSDGKPTLLIAEDDPDIRDFLSTELRETYNILHAKDGQEGFASAAHHIPDLIITDVMMPKVDGKEFCRQIRENPLTCHIPLIMLTALKSEAHELEGLHVGANDYLAKPIRIPILKQRIHNHLEARRELHERIARIEKEAQIEPSSIATNQIDEAMIAKACELVEGHLDDPLFDIENFAQEMGMSRMTLYRKFKAVTGDSPSAFVRAIRMKTAAAHLAQGERNVSEVAALVGFNDLSSFSAAFKKYFDQSPRSYANERRAQS